MDIFNNLWETLAGRADGPLQLRIFLQPAVAAVFAIRAGVRSRALCAGSTGPY
jgi:hypothetical protein